MTATTANTYSGPTTVIAGTLSLNKTDGVNAIAGNIAVSGGTLTLANNNQIANASTATVTGGLFSFGGRNEKIAGISLSGTGLFETGNAAALSTVAITGDIVVSGAGRATFNSGVTISVNGISLSGTNDSAGNILIGGNAAAVTTIVNIGAGGITMTGQTFRTNACTTTGTVVNAGGTLQLQNSIAVVGETLALNGSATAGLGNASGANSWSGAITSDTNGASNVRISSTSGTLTLGGAVGFTNSASGLGLELTGAGGTGTISGNLTGSGIEQNLIKSGYGTWTLNGTNSGSGTTTVNGCMLALGSVGSFYNGDTSKLTTAVQVASGGGIGLNVNSFTAANVTSLLEGNVLASGSRLGLDTSGAVTLSIAITDANLGGQMVLNGGFKGSGANQIAFGGTAGTLIGNISLGGGTRTFNITADTTTIGVRVTSGGIAKTGAAH